MKISTDSWHYKIVNFVFDVNGPSDSLCKYFWQVVWSLFVSMLMAACLGSILGIFLTFFVYYPFVGLINGVWISGAYWLFVLLIIKSEIKKNTANPLLRKILHYSPWESADCQEKIEKNILWQYVATKKEKVCPRIDFV